MSTQMQEKRGPAPVSAAPVAPEPEAPVAPKPVQPAAFAAADVEAFHADDRHAAAAVSGIMVAIFSAGLILYVTIACLVWSWPM